MIRTFETGRIRKSIELSGSRWTFSPAAGEYAGKIYPVVVPCCWETLPEFVSYRGKGTFARRFTCNGGTTRIIFKGVSHTGEVYVDGNRLGSHYNAFTAFDVIIKDLAAGEHLLEVVVDNSFSEASALHIPNDYMTYGGINRGVVLEELQQAYIRELAAIPAMDENGWKLSVTAQVVNLTDTAQTGTVTISLPQTGAQIQLPVTIPANETVSVTGELRPGDVTAWAPENPALYEIDAVVTLDGAAAPVDDLIDRVGFREIRIEGKDILLNGRKIRIKGFCRHEDHPNFGCALPLQAMQQDLAIMKDLGANAVRTSHYPNDELFLDLCDEQGILVWEENHARGLTEEMMRNPNFERQAEDCIREMIPLHINHPSIIIWGILNECASETEYGYDCYSKQYALIKSLDTSRPTSSASCKFKTDICFGLPDIVSYNIYPEWYVDAPAGEYLKDLYRWVQEESEGAGKPFLITETGAGAMYGYRTPTLDKWSEEYQAQALEHQITAALTQEGCSGIFIWQYCDVRISKEWFASRPRTMNNKGVVDEYRRRKLSYETVKNLYNAYPTYWEK